MQVIERIGYRLYAEAFEPWIEPAPSSSEWPDLSQFKDSNNRPQLRVLSLNSWALPIAPLCTERAKAIGDALNGPYDLVALQEIWHARERNIIIERAQKAGYQFYHYFNSAVGFPLPLGHDAFGTGLLVLSKLPLSAALYHSYALSGRPYALHESDFVANKGVGLLRVDTAAGQVDVYVTHLLANYNEVGKPGPGDFYFAHRTGEAYELACFISATRKSALTVVCGDFNSEPDSLTVTITKDLIQFRDAYHEQHPNDAGLTFGTEDNPFSYGEYPMRMDYIFYQYTGTKEETWHLKSCDVFKSFFPSVIGQATPLSDHFGVTATFVLEPADENAEEDEDEKRRSKVKCLENIEQTLMYGRKDAITRRMDRLQRAGLAFLVLWFLLTVQWMFLHAAWMWPIVILLATYTSIEYLAAFFLGSRECSTFTDLLQQLRMHLHAEEQLLKDHKL